jgi:hypothetical protein
MADVDRVRRWVQALESGEFRECRDRFTTRDADGELHDAVGVLITLAMRDGVELQVEWDELLGCARYGDEPDWVLPPEPVCEWIGLDAWGLERYVGLSNDGVSFWGIAALIREDFGLPPHKLNDGT